MRGKSDTNTFTTGILTDDAPSAIYICDAQNYELLYVNKECARICGKSAEAAMGETCYHYLKGLNEPCVNCFIQDTSPDAYTVKEYFSGVSDKKYISKGKIINWQGRRALLEYLSDETERINTQIELHALVDGIPGGVGIYSYYPDGRLEINYLNDGFFALIGENADKRSEYVGRSALDPVHPDDREALFHKLMSDVRSGITGSCDARVLSGAGGYRWMNIRARIASATDERVSVYVTYADIDQRKVAQLNLEANHSAMIMAGLSGGLKFWTYEIDTRKLDLSISGSGASVENVPASLIESGYVHPEDADEIRRMHAELFADAERSECTARLKDNGSGAYIWNHIIYTRLHDSALLSRRAAGVSENVQLQQEARLRNEREAQLRGALLRDSIFFVSINLTTGAIDEMCNQFPDAYQGKTYADYDALLDECIIGTALESHRQALNDTLSRRALIKARALGETPGEINYPRMNAGGGWKWMRVRVSAMSGEAVCLSITDVDREIRDKLALDMVINEEIEYACVINIKSGLLHPVKRNGFSILAGAKDISFEDLARETIDSRVLKEDIPLMRPFRTVSGMVEALKSEPTFEVSFRIHGLKGNVERKRNKIFYLDSSREDIVLSRQEITKLYEEEQRQKAELTRAVRLANEASLAKSDFLSRMSHDIRTPMNAILGLTELMRGEDDIAKVRQYLNDLDASGKYLLGLINDILDLSKVESGKVELREEPYGLGEFQRNIRNVIQPLMNAKHIDFVFKMGCGAESIIVDKLRFNQIFINLLSNAAKFTPEGGRVEFSAVHLPPRGELYGMRFFVRDSGIGMSEEFQKVLFDPFAQENNDSRSDLRGSGLGLAIVKRLVGLMNGEINVKSATGEGTEFTVDLYARLGKDIQTADNGESADYFVLKGANILLVDDNRLNITIAKNMLEKSGCAVTLADDGSKALDAFAKSAPGYFNAIIMDVRMPVMNGIEATVAIRALKRPDARLIPIIAMTADAFSGDREKTGQAGMNAHLSKPIELRELLDTLSALISN